MSYFTKKNISIYIFYGSQTDYAKSVAYELNKKIINKVRPMNINIDILNNFVNYKIHKDDFTIILLSTTGDGEFPDNSNKIFKSLRKNKPRLDNINYCLLGFGDSNYNSFCHSSKVLDRLLKKNHATKFIETEFNDESLNSNEIINNWMEKVILYLQNYRNTLFEWFINSMSG